VIEELTSSALNHILTEQINWTDTLPKYLQAL